MKLVSYDDDSLAVRLHPSEYVKKLKCLLRSQNGCRLIKDEYVGTPVKNLYYLNRLLFRNRHLINLLVRIYLKAVARSNFGYFLCGFFYVILSVVPKPENDIFCCRKYIDKLEMLVNHAYLVIKGILRRFYDNLFSVNENLTVIRKINTGQHVHKRCFTASVFTQD